MFFEQLFNNTFKKKEIVPVIYDREELQSQINKLQHELNKALKAKNYKRCNEINIEMEKCNNKLKSIPTAAKLADKLARLEQDLQKAIHQKQFLRCETIENEINYIIPIYESLLIEEKKRNPISNTEAIENSTAEIPCDNPVVEKVKVTQRNRNHRPVSKLRPKAPITASAYASVFEVVQKMSEYRVDAALLVDELGAIAGIITDNDITRRVISQALDPATTIVNTVMTKNPRSVLMEDSALDALEMMVDNRFRHLPVLDQNGTAVGLLDIAKCMYDAISVLENIQVEFSNDNGYDESKSGEVIVAAVAAALKSTSGVTKQHEENLEMMKQLMEQMFGGTVPTLKTIIGEEEIPSIFTNTSVREASKVMSKIRKGVLIMDELNGKLLGILTPRDLLNRVVAKGLSPDDTMVSTVMTPNPNCVSPDLTLLDALKEMHDHKFLHLPVRESDGKVIGLVDVMELMTKTAGERGENEAKGWRNFFKSSMNIESYGEMSESASNGGVSKESITAHSNTNDIKAKKVHANRIVSKLRPKAPITASAYASVFEVVQKMSEYRVDAALLVDELGAIAGIITDNDITRRVISQALDPATTIVNTVMTKNPRSVLMEDSALDALEMMVDNRFRHLPVLDQNGTAVGLLDIAKCMYDAISMLETIQETNANRAPAITEVVTAALSSNIKNKEQEAKMELMKHLVKQMFGGSVPTLRTIIGANDVPYVFPDTNVREASQIIAHIRKGVLIMDELNGKLLGILTPRDLLNRVVAKGLSPDDTMVSTVMTPNPDCVSPDLTLLDALKEMHDHKFLHLPARESDGKVIGLVDVMELMCSTAGNGNSTGWRDFFGGAMDISNNKDEVSDLESRNSSIKSTHKNKIIAPKSEIKPKLTKRKRTNDQRPVSKLRPKPPVTVNDYSSIIETVKKMAEKRVDAALLLDRKGRLSGIITDNDITRRVISQFVNIVDTQVSEVMTKNPKCVLSDDSALDALEMMVDNRFRHLPVLDKNGAVVGLLDIAKCLYDAISMLEQVQEGEQSNRNPQAIMEEVMSAAMKSAGGKKKNNLAQIQAMKQIMEQMFGGSVPSLRKVLNGGTYPSVRPTANVREAAVLMTKHRKGLLVVDNEEQLVGIITPKDILIRVIAANKPPDLTAVSTVMTASPDCIGPDVTLLDALREMHDHKYLHLPVVESNGKIVGLVDVMDLVGHSTASDSNCNMGWRDFFDGAMTSNDDNQSESASQTSAMSCSKSTSTDVPQLPLNLFSSGMLTSVDTIQDNQENLEAEQSIHQNDELPVDNTLQNQVLISISEEIVEMLNETVDEGTVSLNQEPVNDDNNNLPIPPADNPTIIVIEQTESSHTRLDDNKEQEITSALIQAVEEEVIVHADDDDIITSEEEEAPVDSPQEKATQKKNGSNMVAVGGVVLTLAALISIGAFVVLKQKK
eukprot:gene6721-9214_t